MIFAPYEHQCSECTNSYRVNQAWIDPSQYSNPSEAFLTTTFWCPRCEKGQAVKLRMLPEQKVEIVEPLNYALMINENSPSYYMSSKRDDDEENDEESISAMSEKKALEILSALE